MFGCQQLSLPGWELECANPHCRAPFHYDRTQPGKRYCGERCRTLHNNALIAARQRQEKPPEPRWHLTDPRSEEPDWDAYSAFAGGSEEGARAFLDQFEAVQAMKRTDKRKRYNTEELPMEWQPIETAPKVRDIKILTWGRIPGSWGYHPEEWLVSISQWCGDGWASQASSSFGNRFQPTHWMPLPAPPDTQHTGPTQ